MLFLAGGTGLAPFLSMLGRLRALPRSGHPIHLVYGVTNDADLVEVAALEEHFGTNRVHEIEPATASEDFGLFGAAWDVPVVFWVVGGIDPEKFQAAERTGKLDEIPANHAPDFAPVIHPTLRTGIEAMLAAAGPWLATGAAKP